MNNTNVNAICGFFQGLGETRVGKVLKGADLPSRVPDWIRNNTIDFTPWFPPLEEFCKITLDENTFTNFTEHLKHAQAKLPNILSKNPLSELSLEQRVTLLEEGVRNPLLNGLVFQGLIQDVLLTRMVRAVLPESEKDAVNSTVAKTFRAIVTAAAYAATQAYDPAAASESCYNSQAMAAHFVTGLFFSAIKETPLGTSGSLGAQMLAGSVTNLSSLPSTSAD